MNSQEKKEAIAGLFDKRIDAVRELMEIVNDWHDSADYENTDALSANLEKRRKAIEKVILIGSELDSIRREGERSAACFAGSEHSAEMHELLKQIQQLTAKDSERIKTQMEFYLKEAARLRSGKSRLTAYMKNGMAAHRVRVDLRG
jgi:dsDNA-binding SOS-regulon protein